MPKLTIGRLIVASPFLALGIATLGGTAVLGVGLYQEGAFQGSESNLLFGALIVMTIFGGAFLQFGLDALLKGYSDQSRPLISPKVFYGLGTFLFIPGAWAAMYDSVNGLMLAGLGAVVSYKGYRLAQKTANTEKSPDTA